MNTPKIVCAFLASIGFGATLLAAAPNISGKTDESIRQVLAVVSEHQIARVADGDYKDVATLAELKAARIPEGIDWNYPWGVTLYGVERASDFLPKKTGLDFAVAHNQAAGRYYAFLASAQTKIGAPENEWQDFIKNREKVKIARLMQLGNLDNCGAMGVAMMETLMRRPDSSTPEQKAVAARVADWIVNKQHRLPDGTFWRPEAGDSAPRKWPNGTLWIDDLYMSCPFLVRWAKYTKEPKHIDDAATQVINMAARMQDKDGMWFHAYCEPLKERSPVKWGRANGWAMIATVEILSAMPENHPKRAELLEILRNHIDGIKPHQAASGMWRQVLDNEEIWEETSCSAMFAYCIARAVNRGWIGAENMSVARKAFVGVCTQVTPEGAVNGTCRGTGIGQTVEFYAARPRPDDDMHGRGVVLLAGAEILDGANGKK